MIEFRYLLLINKNVLLVQKWIGVTYGMFPKFPFSITFKIRTFTCCTQISLLCQIHICFKIPFCEMVEPAIFIFRWRYSKSPYQTIWCHIRADCKLVTHHIFASFNNSFLFRYQTRVFISVHHFKLPIMNKIFPSFWGKIIYGKCSKIGGKGKYFNLRGRSRGAWRKLRNKDLHDLNSSENVVTIVMKKDEMWAPCNKHWGRREMCRGYWWETCRNYSAWNGKWQREREREREKSVFYFCHFLILYRVCLGWIK